MTAHAHFAAACRMSTQTSSALMSPPLGMPQRDCSCCIELPYTGGELVSTFTIQEEDETWESNETDAPLVHVAYELPFNNRTDEGELAASRSSPFGRSQPLQVSSPMAWKCTAALQA